jgi:hypothetical protein
MAFGLVVMFDSKVKEAFKLRAQGFPPQGMEGQIGETRPSDDWGDDSHDYQRDRRRPEDPNSV